MGDFTFDVIRRQADAMGCEVFEVGLYKPAVEGGPKEPEMLPRTWDKATLLRSVPWLKYQNRNGRNVYIRPKGEHSLSLVDDLTADAVARMKREGFQPAVVVETSPANFQAWLNHGQVLPRQHSTAVARALAQRFGGDPGAADWRHFGRLAGLTNRKQKHATSNGNYPFVRLVESSGRGYDQAGVVLQQALPAVLKSHDNFRQSVACATEPRTRHQSIRPIESFRADPVYGGDMTRSDLAYAIHALARGASSQEVQNGIRSRDLSHKGAEKRQEEYVTRTVNKAQALTRGQER
jgi:hypothetical protein